MLDMLDVAIGFATVMLAVSLIIMSLTQALSSLLALRGRRLRRGLEELIRRAAPSLEGRAADLSTRIVRHPLISDSAVYGKGPWHWASTIKREELVPVLEAVLDRTLDEDEKKALESWFDSFMARVSQWFAMNTRWITVGLAIVLSFALHIDSLRIFAQIREDSVTRGKLAAMSSTLLDQTPEETARVEGAYLDALKEIVAAHPGQFKAGTSVNGVAIANRAQAIDWIRDNARTPQDAGDLVARFGEAAGAKLTTALDKSIDRALTLQADLTSAGIDLYPAGHTWRDWSDWPHLWGILISVLLLSLGAPFWFNVLKNTASLRSVVAKQEKEEQDADARKDGHLLATPRRQRLSPLPAAQPRAPERPGAVET